MLWEDSRASCQALKVLCVSAFKGGKWNDLIDLGLSVSSSLLFLASSSSFSFSSLSSFNSYLCFSFCFEVCIQLVSIIVIIKTLMGSTGFLLSSSRSTLLVKRGENQRFTWVVSSPSLLQKPLDSTRMQISWSFTVADAVRDTKNHSLRVIDLIFLTSHCIFLPSLNTWDSLCPLKKLFTPASQYQYASGKEVISFILSVRKKKNLTQIKVVLLTKFSSER